MSEIACYIFMSSYSVEIIFELLAKKSVIVVALIQLSCISRDARS